MKKVLIGGAVFLVVIVAVLMLVLGNINSIVKKGVETAGPKILKAPVTLNKVDISVLSGSGKLSGLTIGNPAGFQTEYAFQLGKVEVELETGSVTTDTIHVKNILIDSPSIIFEGAFDKNNLGQLQANAAAYTASVASSGPAEEQQAADSEGKKILLDHLAIQNGDVSVSMKLLSDKELTVELPTIELNDIGKDKDTTLADAMKLVLAAINKAVVPAIQSELNLDEEVGKAIDALHDEAGDALQGGTDNGLGQIKGLFGK
jgi:hypothetical protein